MSTFFKQDQVKLTQAEKLERKVGALREQRNDLRQRFSNMKQTIETDLKAYFLPGNKHSNKRIQELEKSFQYKQHMGTIKQLFSCSSGEELETLIARSKIGYTFDEASQQWKEVPQQQNAQIFMQKLFLALNLYKLCFKVLSMLELSGYECITVKDVYPPNMLSLINDAAKIYAGEQKEMAVQSRMNELYTDLCEQQSQVEGVYPIVQLERNRYFTLVNEKTANFDLLLTELKQCCENAYGLFKKENFASLFSKSDWRARLSKIINNVFDESNVGYANESVVIADTACNDILECFKGVSDDLGQATACLHLEYLTVGQKKITHAMGQCHQAAFKLNLEPLKKVDRSLGLYDAYRFYGQLSTTTSDVQQAAPNDEFHYNRQSPPQL